MAAEHGRSRRFWNDRLQSAVAKVALERPNLIFSLHLDRPDWGLDPERPAHEEEEQEKEQRNLDTLAGDINRDDDELASDHLILGREIPDD
jgi:hypothetical protein